MNTYLFTVPLAPGKTQAWKNYVKEITGPRSEEHKKSRMRAGVTSELVYLQQTPHGDMCVVMLGGENPTRSFELLVKSSDPFDKWFREKILIEAHGLDLSQPMPQNERILDYRETPTREYAGSKKNG